MVETIAVEVAAGLPHQQVIIALVVPSGTTAAEAVRRAELERHLPGLEIREDGFGIFGKRCRPDQVLAEGDRVEVYRPLRADPREVRRQLAELERARRGKKAR